MTIDRKVVSEERVAPHRPIEWGCVRHERTPWDRFGKQGRMQGTPVEPISARQERRGRGDLLF